MSHRNYAYFYLFLWFIFIALCCYLTPYFANDYRYLLISGTHDKVSSIADIFISQYDHYFDWGGRTVAHVIAQYLLYIGKEAQALVSAFTYCLTVYLICYIGRNSKKLTLKYVFIATFLLWACLRYFGEVVFNVVSSSNYLFTSCLVLIYLIPYVKGFSNRDSKSLLFSFLFFLLGIIAGWCNENTGFALGLVIGLVCLTRLAHRNLRFYEAAGLVGLAIGYLLLVLAPGNFSRLDSMESKGFDFFDHFIGTFGIIFETIVCLHILLLMLIFVIIKGNISIRRFTIDQTLKKAFFIFAIGLASLLIMMFSPNFPARSTTLFTFCTVISILLILTYLTEQKKTLLGSVSKNVLTTLACAYMLVTTINTALAYATLHQDGIERDQYIKEELAKGVTDLVVPPMHLQNSKYIYAADVRADRKYWTNNIVKNYYQVNSIVRSCDPEQQHLYNDFKIFVDYKQPLCK